MDRLTGGCEAQSFVRQVLFGPRLRPLLLRSPAAGAPA